VHKTCEVRCRAGRTAAEPDGVTSAGLAEKPAEAEAACSRGGPGLLHLVIARRAEYLPAIECDIPPGEVRGRRDEFGAAGAPGRTPLCAVHDCAVLARVLGGAVLYNGAIAQH